jgi:hypothetical protein
LVRLRLLAVPGPEPVEHLNDGSDEPAQFPTNADALRGLASGGPSPDATLLAVPVTTTESLTTRVTIDQVTGDFVVVGYTGLPANLPKTYGNFLAVWENTAIPWLAPPLARQVLDSDGEQGSMQIGFTVTGNSYIVGYGVGEGITSICATALVHPGGVLGAPSSVLLTVESVLSNTVAVRYETLYGYLPHTFGNQVALYLGYASPYAPGTNLVKSVPVPSDSSVGHVVIDGIDISVGLVYTVAYFSETRLLQPNTAVAAILTFETSKEPQPQIPS